MQAVVVIPEGDESAIADFQYFSGTVKVLDATVFVVAVGSGMDRPSIKQIASREDYVYSVNSFSDLMTVTSNLSDQICGLEGMS